MIAELFTNPVLDFLRSKRTVGVFSCDDKSNSSFAIPRIWDAHDGSIVDLGHSEQAVFNLQGVNILPTANDQVFDSARDSHIAIS